MIWIIFTFFSNKSMLSILVPSMVIQSRGWLWDFFAEKSKFVNWWFLLIILNVNPRLRIVTFHTLGTIYSDFLTNWTDSCICAYLCSMLGILVIYRDKEPHSPAGYFFTAVQILYEIWYGFWNSKINLWILPNVTGHKTLKSY